MQESFNYMFFGLVILISYFGLYHIYLTQKAKQAYYITLYTMCGIGILLFVGAQLSRVYWITIPKKTMIVLGLLALIFIFELISVENLLRKIDIHAPKVILITTLGLEMILMAVIVIPALHTYYLRMQNIMTALIILVGLLCLKNKKVLYEEFSSVILIFSVLILVLAIIQIFLSL